MGLKWKEKTKQKKKKKKYLHSVNSEMNEEREEEEEPRHSSRWFDFNFPSCTMFEDCSGSRITFKFNSITSQLHHHRILGKFHASVRIPAQAAYSAERVFQKCLELRRIKTLFSTRTPSVQLRQKITSVITAIRSDTSCRMLLGISHVWVVVRYFDQKRPKDNISAAKRIHRPK